MVVHNAEMTGQIKYGDAHIERNGGWRTYMKMPTNIEVGKSPENAAYVRKFPRATLASAFLLAKMGDPSGARKLLDFLKIAVGECSFKDTSISTDFVLVDAHVRVYEDRSFSKTDSRQLTSLLSTLPADDLHRTGACRSIILSTAALHQRRVRSRAGPCRKRHPALSLRAKRTSARCTCIHILVRSG